MLLTSLLCLTDLQKHPHLIIHQADALQFDFAQRFNGACYIQAFKRFILAKGFDFKRVQLVLGLIYINMSPLHHAPFDQALHALGRTILHDVLYGSDAASMAMMPASEGSIC